MKILHHNHSTCSHEQDYEVGFACRQTSPGKNAIFLSIYLLHLLPFSFSSMDFALLSKLIQRMLSLYEIRIPQTRDLPPTSFRFHLAMDTLVLSYGYYCLHHSGLKPYR
jgi:hypothetical protein